MTEQYVKVFEFLLRHPELTLLEAMLISEVIRWEHGCYKSSKQLGELLKTNTRTIQRRIKSLVKRQWLAVEYTTKQRRFIFATPKDPPKGPLFDYKFRTEVRLKIKESKKVTAGANE